MRRLCCQTHYNPSNASFGAGWVTIVTMYALSLQIRGSPQLPNLGPKLGKIAAYHPVSEGRIHITMAGGQSGAFAFIGAYVSLTPWMDVFVNDACVWQSLSGANCVVDGEEGRGTLTCELRRLALQRIRKRTGN